MSALEQNIEKLNGHLARFQRSGILHRIAGADHAGGGGVFETLSPVDKSKICQVARVDEALSPINASLPAGARFYKSTTLLTRNGDQLNRFEASLGEQGFSVVEQEEMAAIIADIRVLMTISAAPSMQSQTSIAGFSQITISGLNERTALLCLAIS